LPINVGERLKDNLLTYIDNLVADIESVPESIASQAQDHIHSNDVILTYGQSGNVLVNFFKEAAESIIFEVVVCESAPSYSG
jgi:translation initiation factor eIF-2B subunit beta